MIDDLLFVFDSGGFEDSNTPILIFDDWRVFLLYVTFITLSQIPGFFKTLGHLFWWNIPVDGVSGQLQLTVVVSPAGHLP